VCVYVFVCVCVCVCMCCVCVCMCVCMCLYVCVYVFVCVEDNTGIVLIGTAWIGGDVGGGGGDGGGFWAEGISMERIDQALYTMLEFMVMTEKRRNWIDFINL